MVITKQEVEGAAADHADSFTEQMRPIAELSFVEGVVWVLNLIEQKMKEI
jgi:hypothetical protein